MSKAQFQKHKKGWIKSFASGICQDEFGDFLPWMNYDTIDYFNSTINKTHNIFEYGFGSSTLFFAKRAKKVTVIESNLIWHKNFLQHIGELPKNIEIILMPDALENEKYEAITTATNEKFDLIVIDSLKRAKCAKNAIDAIKNDGRIFLDDSQRKGYEKIFTMMLSEGFKFKEFEGIAPGQITPKKGSVFFN
jgi:hypothetical protein